MPSPPGGRKHLLSDVALAAGLLEAAWGTCVLGTPNSEWLGDKPTARPLSARRCQRGRARAGRARAGQVRTWQAPAGKVRAAARARWPACAGVTTGQRSRVTSAVLCDWLRSGRCC